jgi:hypothetical protein
MSLFTLGDNMAPSFKKYSASMSTFDLGIVIVGMAICFTSRIPISSDLLLVCVERPINETTWNVEPTKLVRIDA